MATPVYLFTGFLDSGKTSLILDTLNDPSFMEENSRTLIICFEQGEVRYNDKYLAERKAFVEYMDSPDDLNAEKIRELDTIYQPSIYRIQWNPRNYTVYLVTNAKLLAFGTDSYNSWCDNLPDVY